MSEDVYVILNLSQAVQTLLEEQGVNLYEEIQRQLPSVRLTMQSDPGALQGSRDIVTVIAVTSTLISTLTPIILRILNMISPPDRSQTYLIEETITQQPDGGTTVVRKRVLSQKEQRPIQFQEEKSMSKAAQNLPPEAGKGTGVS
jgi:hypothetical protein